MLEAADEVPIAEVGRPIDAVGITNQRASTIVWDRATGRPIGPALGWQDLRTVGECIMAKAEHGLALAPNQSATKVGWLLANAPTARDRDLCFGTVDTWLAWVLSEGALHVTDHSNAAVTGLLRDRRARLERRGCCEAARRARSAMLPHDRRLVGRRRRGRPRCPGAPPIAALAGDQQASLVGQGCVAAGQAKITFGTGGMLDICTGSTAPADGATARANGTFPIVAWSAGGELTWGVEAIMLSAGTQHRVAARRPRR